MPDDPVPNTATLSPLKLIFLFGHFAVCKICPLNFSKPLIFGVFGFDRHPIAVITNLDKKTFPFSKKIFQLFELSI